MSLKDAVLDPSKHGNKAFAMPRCCYKILPRSLLWWIKVVAVVAMALVALGSMLYYIILHGGFDPSVTNKVMVIYSMPDTFFGTKAQGMFADWIAVVGAMRYGLMHGAAGVRVDYESPFYVDKDRGANWFSYFFEPVILLDSSAEAGDREEEHFDKWVARYGKVGSFSQLVVNKGSLPKSDPFSLFPYPVNGVVSLEEVRLLVSNFITIKPEIVEKVNTQWDIITEGDDELFVIGVHCRGTDKVINYPYSLPPYEFYDFYVQEILAMHKPDKWKVFVASDELEFIKYADDTWGSKCIYLDDVPRMSRDDPDARSNGVHKSPKFLSSPYEKAESAILDMLLLARSSYLIKNRSSLSDTALAFNPSLEYVFILGAHAPVYSTENMPMQPPISVLESVRARDNLSPPN